MCTSRIRQSVPGFLLAIGVICATGCQSAGHRFLQLVGLGNEPLSLALTIDPQPTKAAEALNPFKPYAPLQKALGEHLGRPVAVDCCFPFQTGLGLEDGWYDLAVVTPGQFARLKNPAGLRVVAVPVDEAGRVATGAVLIVPRDSEIEHVADLRGQRVIFGPADDSRTHYAGLELLKSAGLSKGDLKLEVLPVPGSLMHRPNMHATAQAVLSGSADAGFIDEATWEALPDAAQDADEPSQDKLRVVGRTIALPGRLLVASPKLGDATIADVRSFLLAVGQRDPDVVEPLGIAGFGPPPDTAVANALSLQQVVRPSKTRDKIEAELAEDVQSESGEGPSPEEPD